MAQYDFSRNSDRPDYLEQSGSRSGTWMLVILVVFVLLAAAFIFVGTGSDTSTTETPVDPAVEGTAVPAQPDAAAPAADSEGAAVPAAPSGN